MAQRRGLALNRAADFDRVRRAKERLCYVACDYERELQVRASWQRPDPERHDRLL